MAIDSDSAYTSEADRLDEDDALRSFRARFHIPTNWIREPVIYFSGNSLGLQPVTTIDYIEHELRQWREIGVEGHFSGSHPWMPYHEFVADGLASVVGARRSEVVAMNTLSVNLHLLMVSFFRPSGDRTRILIEQHAFPSDRYAAASQLTFHGLDVYENLVEMMPRSGEETIRTSDIIDYLDAEGSRVALVLLGGVNYYTGQLFNMPAIVEAGHRNGCTVGLDLAHAAGNVPMALHDWDADFAVWCTYKYLNAGPGAVGAAFIHERHGTSELRPRFAGWWGHKRATRFDMPDEFDPTPNAEGWMISNSPILSLASLRASLEIFESAGMPAIREKSIKLTGFLERGLVAIEDRPFEIITPENPDERGAQLSLRFDRGAHATFEQLKRQDVVCDYREPNVIRVAPAPLYNSFSDVARFVEIVEGHVKAAQ